MDGTKPSRSTENNTAGLKIVSLRIFFFLTLTTMPSLFPLDDTLGITFIGILLSAMYVVADEECILI